MIELKLNNNAIFSHNILNSINESPELFELYGNSLEYLNNSLLKNEKITIVNDNLGAPKENYDIYYNEDYIGHIFLKYEVVTEFWSIYLLIFPEFRRSSYAKYSLSELIKKLPGRKWEAILYKKNINFELLQFYLLNLGFESINTGDTFPNDESIYIFKKASTKIITIIGTAYLQPIADLLNNLLIRSKGGINEIQTSQIENGYCSSICILLMVFFESILMRDYYYKKGDKIHTVEFINTHFENFPYIEKIQECYFLRDCLVHNHIWEIDHSYYDFKISDKKIMNFSGNKKFRNNIDAEKLITKNLGLNINPIRVNRNDVKIVFRVIWDSLNYFSKEKGSEIFIPYSTVYFNKRLYNFSEVYEFFMKKV